MGGEVGLPLVSQEMEMEDSVMPKKEIEPGVFGGVRVETAIEYPESSVVESLTLKKKEVLLARPE